MRHDPAPASASVRSGIAPRTWFTVIIVGELVFGGVLALILYLANGPAHNSEYHNMAHDLHAHYNVSNNQPLPAIDQIPAVVQQNSR